LISWILALAEMISWI